MTPTSTVAYLALFAGVAFLFSLVSLMLGKLLRAHAPSAVKLEPYECGEPAVGSAFLQFDLRFYVVALVFIIFEVEVALFFPPAAIFGKATHLMDPRASEQDVGDLSKQLDMKNPARWGEQDMYPPRERAAADARMLALAAMADLGLFFAVILVGFAYVWWRGDLDWVRAVGETVSQRVGETAAPLKVAQL
jgi:NADH-quinone oxidoreductase subunit A